MTVITFTVFGDKVRDGTKRQTIRLTRKRSIKVGDKLSLREWTERPYASKQRVLRDGERCTESLPVTILAGGAILDYEPLLKDELEALAKADGFQNFAEMRDWFERVHGLPFEGVVIRW